MWLFFDEWMKWFEIRHLASDETSLLDELMKKPEENPSIGLLLCEKMNKGVVEFAVRDKAKPLGIATYKTLKSIPKPYRSLAPVIEGVRRELANGLKERISRKRRGFPILKCVMSRCELLVKCN